MRLLFRLVLAITLGLLVVHPLQAQKKKPPPPLKIKSIRPGLPRGGDAHRVRIGVWNPVYVTLEAGEDDIGNGEYTLVNETSDGDTQSVFTVGVPAIPQETVRKVLTYYRPGDRGARVSVTLRKRSGATVESAAIEPRFGEILEPGEVLYLGVGTPLGGLRKALMKPKQLGEDDEQEANRADHELAVLDRPEELPNRWFGYQAADVIFLSTSNSKFVQGLRQNDPGLQALADWLRRGGRLVLSVGRNFQEVRELLPRLGLRDFTLEKSERVTNLGRVATWAGAGGDSWPGEDGLDAIRLGLTGGAFSLVEAEKDGRWPVMAMATVGMGCVLLAGFDLDAPAVQRWAGERGFWERIRTEMGPRVVQGGQQDRRMRGGLDTAGEIGTSLQRGLENFEEVPVISFGWVAFFILIYIIIVGPLDYWFLKKVVKRLELTWVTFPLVVLVVSVAAYFTAYKLKGNHMRINKVDVVDIDLRSGEVQGTTWLALFSPNVKAYTVGFAPAPDWCGGGKEDDDYGTLAGTINTPDNSMGGVDRPSSQSLFRRPYSYAPDAVALRGVPVPVWASRSFTGTWRAETQPGRMIEVVTPFGPSADGERLNGTLRSNLPVELTDVMLLYRGGAYGPRKLAPGETLNIGGNDAPTFRGLVGQTSTRDWLAKAYPRVVTPKSENQSTPRRKTKPVPPGNPFGERPDQIHEDDQHAGGVMRLLLFHQAADQKTDRNNSGLRLLDQGWRVRGFGPDRRFPNEAILIGRASQAPATAETVTLSGVSPTRLWLGTLPGEGDREPVPGFLGQDTYVRIYIPVSPK